MFDIVGYPPVGIVLDDVDVPSERLVGIGGLRSLEEDFKKLESLLKDMDYEKIEGEVIDVDKEQN